MLKIRNLVFALSLSPLLCVTWQLPNQAQTSPSGSTAGTNSGAATGASQTSIFSSPGATTPIENTITVPLLLGVSATFTTGVSTTGNLTVGNAGAGIPTVTVTAATTESTSSSITVTDSAAGGTVVLTLSPEAQVSVTQLATAILQSFSNAPSGGTATIASILMGDTLSPAPEDPLVKSLIDAGASPQLAQKLVASMTGLFASPKASLQNLPVAQSKLGQLVASSKASKPISIIGQANAAVNVNINQLNDAIIAYNSIILQSKPDTLKKLAQIQDFVTFGKMLKELRRAIP